jgi:hypothetical protein
MKYGLVEGESGFVHAKAVCWRLVVCFIGNRKNCEGTGVRRAVKDSTYMDGSDSVDSRNTHNMTRLRL